MDPLTPRYARSSLRRPAAVIGVLLVVLASLYTHLVVVVIASQNCTVGFDTSSVAPPADASPQGWLCGESGSAGGLIIWFGGFVLSLVVTVALVVLAWRKWSWRAGVPALASIVLLPLATAWILNLPPDDCTADARSSNPDWACNRG